MNSAEYGKPAKRSISIAGHRTSLSLERAYWDRLQDLAKRADTSVAKLVEDVDAHRGEASLSSALRQFMLADKPQ